LTKLAPIRQRLLRAISQLSIAYRDSPLSVDATGERKSHGRAPWRRHADAIQAGDRVPDARLADARSGQPLRLFDLISRGWTLLLFPGERAAPEAIAVLDALAAETRAAVGDAVQPLLVLESLPGNDVAIPSAIDRSGDVAVLFGARDGLVALVRPDGYLGYRGRPDQAGELASYLARVFAMRLRGLGDQGGDRG
jgi:hypothetical protein